MNVIWIILGVLSFIGGQAYLVYLLGKLDKFLKGKAGKKSASTADDSCTYSQDVIE